MARNHVTEEIRSSPKHYSFNDFEDGDAIVCGDGEGAFEEDHLKLRESVLAVFNDTTVADTLEGLYRHVENLNQPWKRLSMYQTLDSLFSAFAKEQMPFFNCDRIDIRKASSSWERYCQRMLMARNIFLSLDQKILDDEPEFRSLWDMGLILFRKLVVMHDNVQSLYIDKIIELICAERRGDTVERDILKSLISMFLDLSMYTNYFEPRFLHETEKFYGSESAKMTSQMTISEYLKYAESRIKEEEERVKIYLNRYTRNPLSNVLNNELIAKQKSFLLSALSQLIIDENFSDLRLLYRLLARIPDGIASLREELKKISLHIGWEIVNNPTNSAEKDKEMIMRLLKFRDNLINCIRESFHNDAPSYRIVNDTFEDFINRRPNKPAELLAKYVDLHLRASRRNQLEGDFDKLLDKVMTLFRYIYGKDAFRAYYSNLLCKRLICGRSASIDAEKSVLSRLKQECGADYTRTMEFMFQDIELSQDLSEKFQQSRPDAYSIDFSICILAPASWPDMPRETASYPPEMIAIRKDFEEFYLSHHRGRKLTYVPYFGSCVVKAHFPSAPNMAKDLQVSEYQALILLQFNDSGDEGITYAALAEATGIGKPNLDRALVSFTATKSQRVLISQPLTAELTDKTTFFFNKKFTHNLTRIRFNQIQLKETKQEHEVTEANIVADRAAHVDCAIVRIMKARKTVEHSQLISEVIQQLKFPYKSSELKKRIELLISRDFISRDPESTSRYHYVA